MTATQEWAADQAALARCAGGSAEGLDVLYAHHAAACFARARSVLVDADHAADAVQEAFLDVWRRPERYDSQRCSVRSWLLMLTHRRAVDRVRAEQRRRTTPLGPAHDRPDEAPTPDVQALAAAAGQQTRAALAVLPDVKREVLVLAYWGGYTQREIAGLTRTPLGTVKTRMRSALMDLNALLAPAREHEGDGWRRPGPGAVPGPSLAGPTGPA